MRATDYLTGMRAYAALAVLMIHVLGTYAEDWPLLWRNLVHNGKFGVIIFFTLSGFVISMSVDKTEIFKFWWYMMKRFLRIAPLYYVMLVLAVLISGREGLFPSLFLHVTFLNLFTVHHLGDLLGVEWSIPIEMFYYLLLPAAVMLVNRRHGWALVVLATVAIYLARWVMLELTPDDYARVAKDLGPLTYAPSFAIGVLSYKIYRDRPSLVQAISQPAVTLAILAAVAVQIATGWVHDRYFYTVITAAIILTSLPKNWLASLLLANPVAVYLGQISYSIYLTHVLVTGVVGGLTDHPFARLALVIGATVAFSSLTYFFIERPFQRVPVAIMLARPRES